MKKIFLSCFFFALFFSLKATHNRSGEILYKRIPPYTSYTYSITVIKYTDDGPGIADRCADTVYFGDGSKDVAYRINGPSGCGCGMNGSTAITCGSLIVNNRPTR